MRKATQTVAASFGIIGGLAGIEHGVFEILRGDIPPEGFMFPSMGPPCVPEEAWHLCEPALTILPNLLVTGILAVILSLAVILWSAAFISRSHGGLVLILLSIALLLFGGGVFPPVIALIGGVAALKIYKPFPPRPDQPTRGFLPFLAKLWPWTLALFIILLIGQWIVGFISNTFMQQYGHFNLLGIITLIALSPLSAYAHDRVMDERSQPTNVR